MQLGQQVPLSLGNLLEGNVVEEEEQLEQQLKAVPRLKWETAFIDSHMSRCVRTPIPGTGSSLSSRMPNRRICESTCIAVVLKSWMLS